jgi:hypothetical protein
MDEKVEIDDHQIIDLIDSDRESKKLVHRDISGNMTFDMKS